MLNIPETTNDHNWLSLNPEQAEAALTVAKSSRFDPSCSATRKPIGCKLRIVSTHCGRASGSRRGGALMNTPIEKLLPLLDRVTSHEEKCWSAPLPVP